MSAVLLFQYDRLVTALVTQLDSLQFQKGELIQLGAVSGDLSERVAKRCCYKTQLSILELTCTGIRHTMKKLDRARIHKVQFIRANANAVPLRDGSVDGVFSFFLFHELPTKQKRNVFFESLRVVRHGGQFVFVEFHRPRSFLLRLLGTTIFGLFEPHAKEMWHWDPLQELDGQSFSMTRTLHFGGYFQVVRIDKH